MELEPITRQEKIIAGQDLTPITRQEMFLKKFGGGGGSGGSADAVLYTAQTLTDAQKKQARDNIEAAITDFVVNATFSQDGTVSADKTYDQIRRAIEDGKQAVATLIVGADISILPFTGFSTTDVTFAGVTNNHGDVISSASLVIKPDGGVSFVVTEAPAFNSDGALLQVSMDSDPTEPMEIATKGYVDDKECILHSTTPGSTKKFKITVDDSGAISATEVTA